MKPAKAIILLVLLLFMFDSCNKRDKLNDDVDPNSVQFSVTQPSIAIARFIVKCTNYDISMDSVSFLSPDNALYIERYDSQLFQKEEEFGAGTWESADGLWVLQFTGKIQDTGDSFSVSVPYTMNLDDDNDEE